jgi:hypothetical protein
LPGFKKKHHELTAGEYIMNDNKGIFETIIDVLRKANIGFSINEVKDIFFEQNKEDQKPKTDENEYNTPKKYEY